MTIDHLSPPADRLRAAATLLREQAEGCYPYDGPWRHDPVRQWPVVGQIRTDNDDPHGLIAELWSSAECGQYMATMRPGVGLALADWLDFTATWTDGIDPSRGEVASALAVADAILRIPAAKTLAEQAATR